jgi:hypothetical protein
LKTVLEVVRPNGVLNTYPTDADYDFIEKFEASHENGYAKFATVAGQLSDANSDLQEFVVLNTNDQFSVTMRFSHYVTPVQQGATPLYFEQFEVLFRMESLAEKCDASVLTASTLAAFQEYEVTKDNNPFPEITKTVIQSALVDCPPSTTL